MSIAKSIVVQETRDKLGFLSRWTHEQEVDIAKNAEIVALSVKRLQHLRIRDRVVSEFLNDGHGGGVADSERAVDKC